MMKKVFQMRALAAMLVLCVCMVLFPLTVSQAIPKRGGGGVTEIVSPYTVGSGTEADPFVLSTAEQFMSFKTEIEQKNNFNGSFVKLGADIDLGEYCGEGKGDWVPIGLYERNDFDEYVFDGTFDGDGHTISGLYIANGGFGSGLFSELEKHGVIKNLNVKGTVKGSGERIGGIVGSNLGSVINCSIAGDVSGKKRVGGIVGNSSGFIENCSSTGNFNGDELVGGIVGFIQGELTACKVEGNIEGNKMVGGVCGRSNGGVVGCEATVKVSGDNMTGGILGAAYKNCVQMCHNNNSKVFGGSIDTGGVVGLSNALLITECTSSGCVSATGKDVGGIAGGNAGPITNCTNDATVKSSSHEVGGIAGSTFACQGVFGTVSYCTNNGDVSSSQKDYHVGGIVGWADYQVCYCTNNGKVNGVEPGEDNPYNIIGYGDPSLVIQEGVEGQAGIAVLAGSTIGEGNWMMILVFSGIAVIALAAGAFLIIRRRKKLMTAAAGNEED